MSSGDNQVSTDAASTTYVTNVISAFQGRTVGPAGQALDVQELAACGAIVEQLQNDKNMRSGSLTLTRPPTNTANFNSDGGSKSPLSTQNVGAKMV